MSVKEILINAGFKITSENSEFLKMRPLHRQSDSSNALSVNARTGYWTDFVTGEKGSIEKLIKLTTGGTVDFEPTIDKLQDLKDEIDISFNKEEIKALLPSYSFYNKKGISNETLALFKSGFCQGGKMYNRFVFPIINPDGSLVGLSGRNLIPQREGKWAKWKNVGPTRKWLYPLFWNENIIRDKKEIILVESIGNMLALWEAGYKNTLVCSGTSLSKERLGSIIGLSPSRIILAFDNDDGNNPGQKASSKIEKELEKWFDKSQISVKLTPVGKDLSDLWQQQGISAIKKWYEI